MAQADEKPVSIEKTKDKVILKIDSVTLTMSPTLARELGDKLFKCGCDVATTAGK